MPCEFVDCSIVFTMIPFTEEALITKIQQQPKGHVSQVHVIPQLFTMFIAHILNSFQFNNCITIDYQVHDIVL